MTSFHNIIPETIHIVTHYYSDDPLCSGDYAGVSVYLNNEKVTTYGDYYHDKGRERADGFMDAVKILFPDCICSKERKADYDY